MNYLILGLVLVGVLLWCGYVIVKNLTRCKP